MSYHIYTTEAFVLHGYQLGEADALYACFTKDFGLVRARATGVRKEASKLRYSLQARIHLSLIKGRAGWRITGAVLIANQKPEQLALFGRLAKLTERLVHGEERNDGLFSVFTSHDESTVSQTDELFAVIKILVTLGYIPAQLLETITSLPLEERAQHIELHRSVLVRTVNDALTSSHL
jgi:recombinational DNA repair protein (RecF pathway)